MLRKFALFAALILCFPAAVRSQDSQVSQGAQPKVEREKPVIDYQVRYVLDDGKLFAVRGDTRQELNLAQGVQAVHHTAEELYLALGERGAAVYSTRDPLVPQLVREIPVSHGSVTGFHQVDGQVWMVVVSTQAVPVGAGAGLGQPAPGAGVTAAAPKTDAEPSVEAEPDAEAEAKPKPPAPPPAAVEPIRIVEVSPGTVELSVGARQGVKVGDRFSIFRITQLQGEGKTAFVGEELAAVVEVIAVKWESCLAELGRGARVSAQNSVRPATPQQEQRLIFPQKLSDLAEVALTVRPLVKVGAPLGGGVLCELEGNYTGDAYFVALRMHPLGLGWTSEGNAIASSILAEGGYDGSAFAVGLGLGLSSVNGDMGYMLEVSDRWDNGGEPEESYEQRTQHAFALSQRARLGARDGLNLSVYNLLIYYHDEREDETGFIYGGTFARLAIPVGIHTDLLLEGGGGNMGYWYASFGVFSWIVGNGGPKSLGLSVSAGGAGVWGTKEITETDYNGTPYTYAEDVEVSGPMVSAGMKYRFGM